VAVVEPHPLIAAILRYGKPITGTAKEIVETLTKLNYELPYMGGGRGILNVLREHRHAVRVFEREVSRGIEVTVTPLSGGDSGVSGVSDYSFAKKEQEDIDRTHGARNGIGKGIGKFPSFSTISTDREAAQ
jgi:hypothetical protein